MKELIYDLETTGLDKEKCAIHQISAIIKIDGIEKERINIKMKPFKDAEISDEALKVCHISKETLLSYQSQEDGYNEFINILDKYVKRYSRKDKFYLIGYNNIRFDNDFLRNFFLRNGNKFFGSYFWSNSIDVMVLSTMILHNKRCNMSNFRLSTVASELNIEYLNEDLHNAITDVDLTEKLYSKFVKLFFKKS